MGLVFKFCIKYYLFGSGFAISGKGEPRGEISCVRANLGFLHFLPGQGARGLARERERRGVAVVPIVIVLRASDGAFL